MQVAASLQPSSNIRTIPVVSDYVTSSSKLARDILQPRKKTKEGQVSSCYRYGSVRYGNPYALDVRSKKKTKEKQARAAVSVLSVLALGVGWARFKELTNRIAACNKEMKRVDLVTKAIAPVTENGAKREVKRIVQLNKAIFTQIKQDAAIDLAILVCFVASAAIALVGAAVPVPNLMKGGVVTGAVSLFAMMLRACICNGTSKMEKSARGIESSQKRLEEPEESQKKKDKGKTSPEIQKEKTLPKPDKIPSPVDESEDDLPSTAEEDNGEGIEGEDRGKTFLKHEGDLSDEQEVGLSEEDDEEGGFYLDTDAVDVSGDHFEGEQQDAVLLTVKGKKQKEGVTEESEEAGETGETDDV